MIDELLRVRARLKRSEIGDWLAAQAARIDRFERSIKLRKARAAAVPTVGFVLAVLILAANPEAGFGALFFIMFFAIVICVAMWPSAPLQLAQQTLPMMPALVAALRDEMSPGTRLEVDYDGRPYDKISEKLERTGRSFAGNTKYYYRDRFLRVDVVLADGTRVDIDLVRKLKKKKGALHRHHRRVTVTLAPDPRRYPISVETLERTGQLESLRKVVREHVRKVFHDPPEELHVRPVVDAEHNTLSMRVVQHDAEILPEEILAIVAVTIDFLDAHARRRARGAR